MEQKHRISTNIGTDQKLSVEITQDFSLLEVLSLKLTQKDVYTSLCSDYGVVCGRVSVNNGLGVPNARISIFIPLSTDDEDDPVISSLYPYKLISDVSEEGFRYNLLPFNKQHGGHAATGTFPDQTEIITREEVLEVYEKYYKYTVKTNNSGDFMIWGVPLGSQTIHVDLDLSDIGCFSLRPDDFIRKGFGVDDFKSSYEFKSDIDIDSLPQIKTFDRNIEVYPFWGSEDLCEIGITRTDFDLSSVGVKIEPKAYLLGSIFSDQGNNTINKNCTPKAKMGRKCDLISEPATIELIRFTNYKDEIGRPILETIDISEEIGDDGAFVLPLPMNMEYVYTNEFGETEITNDPNKGVPTSSCYRLRITTKNDSLSRVRTTASYLIPNIREYRNEEDKSYAWSLDWSDYPTDAIDSTKNIIFNSVDGSYYPQDYFYRFNYNKVYGVSSFMGSYFSENGLNKNTFLGIKEIAPKEEEDCDSSIVTPPVNWGIQKFNFSILLAIIINTFERIVFTSFIGIIQVLIFPFQILAGLKIPIIKVRPFGFLDKDLIEPLQRLGTIRLGISTYPECETCDGEDIIQPTTTQITNPALLYGNVGHGSASRASTVTCNSYYNNTTESVIVNFTDCFEQVITDYSIDPGQDICAKVGTLSGQWEGLLDNGLCTPSGTENPYRLIFDGGFISDTGETLNSIYINYIADPGRYYIVDNTTGLFTQLNMVINNGVYEYVEVGGSTVFLNWSDTSWTFIDYTIYDSTISTTNSQPAVINESGIPSGCQSYNTLYDEGNVSGTYCAPDINTPYSAITYHTNVLNCTTGITVGQVVKNNGVNPCSTCGTRSGYSEFRYGSFTIIPAAASGNWSENFKAISEYSRRKLVGKLFCEGITNYSFTDNWLTGSLYMFPFKAKVRWDNEETGDLNVRRTKYCENLVHFKASDSKFYYRSTKFNGSTFERTSRYSTLGHPTTVVDLGPRDEFIKDICTDASLDPNCSVIRNIGPSSYQDFKEMLGLYVNTKMDLLGKDGNYKQFFKNTGYDFIIPQKINGHVLNGDILQLISINNEAGIEEFDLQNKNYVGYSPGVLDVDGYPELFTLNDGIPINLVLDDGEGYRVRSCLNEPGNLTESSQRVPFFLWDKKGSGFGKGVNQSWDYSFIKVLPLQGMALTGVTESYIDEPHQYVLFPMTKDYSGFTKDIGNVDLNDITFSIESTGNTYTQYNDQPEGFTFLYITGGTLNNPTAGLLYTRVGTEGGWDTQNWNSNIDFIVKPTSTNYVGNKQILSTPFLFYFGLRPGKTAVDKFIDRFGPKGAFPTIE